MSGQKPLETGYDQICFGLNRELDERSLVLFLRLFNHEELLCALIPRLSDDEVSELVDYLTSILRRHLTEKEYHELFLGDYGHRH